MFASPHKAGLLPYRPTAFLEDHIKSQWPKKGQLDFLDSLRRSNCFRVMQLWWAL
jgi:hypothetical protein